MQYEDYINSLKVGDEIIYGSSTSSNRKDIIKTITPKGTIKTENGVTFNNLGHNKQASAWHISMILNISDENTVNLIKEKELNDKLNSIISGIYNESYGLIGKLSLEQKENLLSQLQETKKLLHGEK